MARPLILLALLGALLATGLAGCSDPAPAVDDGTRLDRLFIYPASHIFLKREGTEPKESLERVLLVQSELDGGTPFAEVARRRSDNPDTAPNGGFLGFFRPDGSGEFAGAIQALPPGSRSGPIDTEDGTQFFLRHTFEEGRAIERELFIPAYGLFIPWDPSGQGGLSKDEARVRAEQAAAKVSAGEMTFEEANEKYGIHPPRRPDFFIANVTSHGAQKAVYDQLKPVAEGTFAPILEVPGAFGVIRRGHYFRSVFRHILIQHIESERRDLNVRRTREEAEELAKRVLAEARQDGADWQALVTKYSDDLMSIPMAGSMGVRTNGDFRGELEAAILATSPGEVHDKVIEVPDGYHILWRVN